MSIRVEVRFNPTTRRKMYAISMWDKTGGPYIIGSGNYGKRVAMRAYKVAWRLLVRGT